MLLDQERCIPRQEILRSWEDFPLLLATSPHQHHYMSEFLSSTHVYTLASDVIEIISYFDLAHNCLNSHRSRAQAYTEVSIRYVAFNYVPKLISLSVILTKSMSLRRLV